MFKLFKYKACRAFADYETVTVFVERAACFLRLIIVLRRKRTDNVKTCNSKLCNAGLSYNFV